MNRDAGAGLPVCRAALVRLGCRRAAKLLKETGERLFLIGQKALALLSMTQVHVLSFTLEPGFNKSAIVLVHPAQFVLPATNRIPELSDFITVSVSLIPSLFTMAELQCAPLLAAL